MHGRRRTELGSAVYAGFKRLGGLYYNIGYNNT